MTTGGATKYRYRMRCNKCRHRFHWKKTPQNLALIECPVCGGKVHDTQGAYERQKARDDICWCSSAPWRPHVKGTVLGCESHPVHPGNWTIEQERQFQSALETRRGAS